MQVDRKHPPTNGRRRRICVRLQQSRIILQYVYVYSRVESSSSMSMSTLSNCQLGVSILSLPVPCPWGHIILVVETGELSVNLKQVAHFRLPSNGVNTAQKNILCSCVQKLVICCRHYHIYQNDGKNVIFAALHSKLTWIKVLKHQSWSKAKN